MGRSLLARFILLLLFGILPCFLASFILQSPRGSTMEEAPVNTIDSLIAALGSSRFETREAATKALMEKEDAAAALHKALSSQDLEVRRRATCILEALKSKRARRALARARVLGNDGRVVEMVDRLVCWRQWDRENKGWCSLTHFADQLMNRAASNVFPPGFRNLWKKPRLPAGDFPRYAKAVDAQEFSGDKLVISPLRIGILVRGEQVIVEPRDNPGLVYGILVASEDARIGRADYSLLIAGRNVKVDCFGNSILVCDGDVELSNLPDGGLIIARGKVTCKQGQFRNSLIRSGHTLRLPDGKTIDLKNGAADPLAFVKFFELADVGIAAEDLPRRDKSAAAGVRLKEVRKESPFAAGLHSGDVITAIEEMKTPTTEIFRRVLRRKLAEGGPLLTFTVRRTGKTLDVPLPVKD